MKVYEAMARAFIAEGTTDVFGMMGDANMYWMDEVARLGGRLYEVRHEGGGLAMADGFGRMNPTGAPGVATTTSGPGVAQLATTLLVASRARTPLVMFCGESPTGDDSYVQRLDQKRFAEACESGYLHLDAPDQAYEVVQKAFYLARTESRPIMISAPMNVQQGPFDDDAPYVPSNALISRGPVYPAPSSVQAAADVIADTRRPVIIVGRGAIQAGAGAAVLRLAENIGALIATTLMAKTWLSQDEFHAGISGLYATRTAMELFQEADCVIAIGAGLNKYTTEHGYLFPRATFIQVDIKPHIVMGDGRAADIYLHADAKLGTEMLEESLTARGHRATGYRTPEVKERLAMAFDDPQDYELDEGTVDPREACRTLDQVMPPNVGLVIGGGQNICFSTILMTRGRSMMLANQHFGCIGQGLTTAIGAMVANGNQPAFLMEGDAGFMMHLPEFETAVRHRIPICVVILNDQLLGAEYHKAKVKGLNADLARVPTPDLGAVGVALGGRGALVRDLESLRAAAEAYLADPFPTIIDVRISTSVISIPYRRLHFGMDA